MTRVPLRLGPLVADGFHVHRSGIRWLREEGQFCRPGEVIAFCNIGLVSIEASQQRAQPFAQEMRDLQVAFAPRVGGILLKSAVSAHGGFLDRLYHFHRWTPDFVIGELDCPTTELSADGATDGTLRLLFLAGRRVTELTEVRSGLLTGWHNRSRAWWGEDDGAHGTVLSLGICDLSGIIPGERSAFLELFEAVRGPAHVAIVPDNVLVPCAPITLEQLNRTSAQVEALATDFVRLFQANANVPPPADWIFASCLLAALQKSPLTEEYDLLTRTGLHHAESVDAVILSLNAEAPVILRHRRLGYAISLHGFRIQDTSEMMRAWLTANFEPVKRTLDDVRKDMLALVDAVRARLEVKLLVLNALSTLGYEDILTYASFDRPMGDVIASVRNKELNLLLHDIARERDVAIVDVDAIAADLGAAVNLPDGIHGSGRLQAEVRGEIVRILRGCGIPGFRPRAFN